MIAAGLCMMGGCFAQDAAGAAVETYWPAHAVTLEDRALSITDYDTGPPMPFWVPGVRAGSLAENVTWKATGAIGFYWGIWSRLSGVFYEDALFTCFSHSGDWIDGVGQTQGPMCYAIYSGNRTGNDSLGIAAETRTSEMHADFVRLAADYDGLRLVSNYGESYAAFPDRRRPSVNTGGYRISISANNQRADVVAYWWMNDQLPKSERWYFMVQPMCSLAGESAFFTHGFDILTEL